MTRYNSVISTSVSTRNYIAVHVSKAFLNGDAWNLAEFKNHTLITYPERLDTEYAFHAYERAAIEEQIKSLQKGASRLQRLEADVCNNTYNVPFNFEWGNVILVSSLTNDTAVQSVHDVTIHFTGWPFPFPARTCPTQHVCKSYQGAIITPNDPVEYCLAQAKSPHCKVFINSFLLLAILICNAIKLGCLFTLLSIPHFDPCITVGDAIASFLSDSDPCTLKCGALTADDVSCKDSSDSLTLCPEASEPNKSRQKAWNPRRQGLIPRTSRVRNYLALILLSLFLLTMERAY